MGAAEVKIVLAMARRDVDKAGACFRGHEIGEQQRCILLVAMAA